MLRNNTVEQQEIWNEVIRPKSSWYEINLKELWAYRNLIGMYIKRDIVTFYKQTILGPFWFVIQPVLTMISFMFIFGGLAGISTDGLPQAVFYLAGIILWNYFSDCLTRNSKIFIEHQAVFGKVYFPRLVLPVSIVISNLVRLAIQFLIFLIVYIFYYYALDATLHPNAHAFLLPLLVIMIAGLSLGFGLIFSSLTTKYRDLAFLLQFGVQLWTYISPVIYPLRSIKESRQWILLLNPMTSVFETFRYGFLGSGIFSWIHLLYSFCFMIGLLFLGVIVFNRVEKSFMDTV